MEIDLVHLLESQPMVLIFLVIGIGYLLGHVHIAGIAGGPSIGVLLAGLLFGHFGFEINPGVASFGFALFIFSVGIQAGPGFFSAFRQDGLRYIALAVVVAGTGFGIALLVSFLFGLERSFAAGMMAGALTSTPTLAGAQDAVTSGLLTLAEGVDPQTLVEQIGVGYAITYIVGSVGLIVLAHYLPRLLGIDLPMAARQFARERGIIGRRHGSEGQADSLPIIRAYRVSAESFGKTVEQRRAEMGRRGRALRIRRASQLLEAEPDTLLEAGDVISIIASLQDHAWIQQQFGAEVLDTELLNYQVVSREILVTDRHAQGRALRELDLTNKYGCIATGITRTGIDLPVADGVILQKGDLLRVTGEEQHLKLLAEALGQVEESVDKTDLMTFAFGLVAGLLLGLMVIRIGEVSIGLGAAGGLLIAGIVIGYVSSIHPTFGRVPEAARYVLMQLGFMLFMATVAVTAGGGFVEGLLTAGPIIIAGGALVTMIPVLVGYLFGTRVLKMNPVLLLGSITGAMTSTPAMQIISEAARSPIPSLGYAGTYAFANVLLTFAGAFMMLV